MSRALLFGFALCYAAASVADPVSAATWITAASTYTGTAATVIYAVAYVATSVAWAYAISYATNAIFGKKPKAMGDAAIGGRNEMIKSADEPRHYVYGQIKKSGPLAYYIRVAGNPNWQHHLVILLADHECDAITDIWVGDRYIPSADIDGDGWVRTAPWVQQAMAAEEYEAAVPSTPYQITVPGSALSSVVSVMAVFIAGEEPFTEKRFEEIPATEYSRSGNVFTFQPDREGATVKIMFRRPASSAVRLRIKKYLGTTSQAADTDLITASGGEWTSAHQLKGIAYLYVTILEDYDIFPSGIEPIQALVRGKKVYDPRTGTTVWSDNAALVLGDQLMSAYGSAAVLADINSAQWIASANICDELVALDVGGTTQKRYTANGMFRAGDDPLKVREAIAASMAGWTPYVQGEFRITAGAYTTPVIALTADDVAGPVEVVPKPSKQQVFNLVRGKFVSPDNNWELTDFPLVENTTYQTNDGGVLPTDIQLEWVTDPYRAQRIAKIMLERSRQGMTQVRATKLRASNLTPGEIYTDTNSVFGFSAKAFRCTEWRFSIESGITIVGQEEAAASYDWNYGMQTTVDPAPDSDFGFPVPDSLEGFDFYSGRSEVSESATGEIRARIRVVWNEITDATVLTSGFVEIQYRKATSDEWTTAPRVDPNLEFVWIEGAEVLQAYVVRGRVVNSLGQASDWDYAAHVVNPTGDVPTDIEAMTLTNPSSGVMRMEWTLNNPDVIHNGFEIRAKTSGAGTGSLTPDWDALTFVADVGRDDRSWEQSCTGFSGNHCYAIRPFDVDGDYSDGFAIVAVTFVSGAFSIAGTKTATLISNKLPDSALSLPKEERGYVPYLTVYAPFGGSIKPIPDAQQIDGETSGWEFNFPDSWGPTDYAVIFFLRQGVQEINASGVIDYNYSGWRAATDFASPQTRVLFQAYVGVEYATAQAGVLPVNADKTNLTQQTGAVISSPGGGNTFASYARAHVFCDLPAGTDFFMPYIIIYKAGTSTNHAVRIKRPMLTSLRTADAADTAASWHPNGSLRAQSIDISRAFAGEALELHPSRKTFSFVKGGASVTWAVHTILASTKPIRLGGRPAVIDVETDWIHNYNGSVFGCQITVFVSRRSGGVRILSIVDVGGSGSARTVEVTTYDPHGLIAGTGWMETAGHTGSNADSWLDSLMRDGGPTIFFEMATNVTIVSATKFRINIVTSGGAFTQGAGGYVYYREIVQSIPLTAISGATGTTSGSIDTQFRDIVGRADDVSYILHAANTSNLGPSGGTSTLEAENRLLSVTEDRT